MTEVPAGVPAVPPAQERAFARGRWLVSTTGTTVPGRTTFSLYGREWDLLPGVFAPPLCLSTFFFAESVPYPDGGKFLEVGCGTGVISVIAASGCSRVTALDISEAAIENTLLNVARHGLADRVRVIRSDLFSALAPTDRFDLIFWNSPFIDPPEGFEPANDLDRAVFDPVYRSHRRYLAEGRRWLTAGGRLLLGFSNLGNGAALARQASEAGWGVCTLRTSGRMVPDVEYQLLELVAHEP